MNADFGDELHKERVRLRRLAVRTTDVSRNLDIFLACAIAGVLGNRFFLVLTGYPQLGNGTLHISHAIWGGLMMATAIVVAVSFIAPSGRTFIAVVGGAGFGWFVDELGKFITRDVNYFFRPTLALIYVVFIVMYLVFRSLERRRYRSEEGLFNAFEALKLASIGNLDEPQRREALRLLDRTCGDDGLAPKVRDLLEHVATLPARHRPAPGPSGAGCSAPTTAGPRSPASSRRSARSSPSSPSPAPPRSSSSPTTRARAGPSRSGRPSGHRSSPWPS